MCAQNHGMLFPQRLDHFTDLYDLLRIQTNCRLIQNNDLRQPHQRLGQPYPLTVAFGKIADQPVLHRLQLCQIHHLFNICHLTVFIYFFQFRYKLKIFQNLHVAIYRRKFGQIPDTLFCLFRLFVYIVSINNYFSGSSADVAGNHIHGGRFSRAVGTEEAIDIARFQSNVQIIYSHILTILFCKMSDFNQNFFLLYILYGKNVTDPHSNHTNEICSLSAYSAVVYSTPEM